jgi:mannose-6-phosphate isomerase-like protein (cupin superfamily)
MRAIISAVKNFCEWAASRDGETRSEFERVLSAVDWNGDIELPEPIDLPVVEWHLRTACGLSGAGGSPARALAEAVLVDAASLSWLDMYEQYDDEPDMAVFRRSYAYTTLIGPDAPLPCRELYMGISLQGPDIYYPPHAHRAVETYAVIGGTGDWKRGLEPWTSRPPGDLILHPSGVRHAMQSNAEPLLALGFWTTELESAIVIVRG